MQFSPPLQDFKTWGWIKNKQTNHTTRYKPQSDLSLVIITPNLWALLFLFSKAQTFLFVAHPAGSTVLYSQHHLLIDVGSWCNLCCSGARRVSFLFPVCVTHNSSTGLFGIHKGYITKAVSTGVAQILNRITIFFFKSVVSHKKWQKQMDSDRDGNTWQE